MSANGYYTRLAAATVVAGISGLLIATPDFGRRTAARAEEARIARLESAERACATGAAPLAAGFADLSRILAVAPLGPARPPGADPAPPFIRVLPKRGPGAADGLIEALAPGRVDVVAIEGRPAGVAGGTTQAWSVWMKPCDGIVLVYDGIDEIDESLLRRARAASVISASGDGRAAIAARIRLREGDVVGRSRGFNLALSDLAAPAVRHAAPAPGREIPAHGAGDYADSPTLARALGFDRSRARCPLDYLAPEVRTAWTQKVADWRGIRLAVGASSCARAALAAGADASGPWFTDSSHNARADRVRAIALADDPVDPGRLVFALDGVLRSLAPGMIAASQASPRRRAELAAGPVTFDPRDGRINAPFTNLRDNETYCFEDLRIGFSGPVVDGVILMRIERAGDAAPLLKMEARADAAKCLDLPEPWTFSGGETSFFRRR